MPRRSNVDCLLTPDDRKAFQDLARKPTTTVDDLLAWLDEHGYQLSRGSVGRWKQKYDGFLADARRSAELSASFLQATKDADPATLSYITLTRMQHLLLDKLFSIESGDTLDDGVCADLTAAVSRAAHVKQRVETLHAAAERHKAAAAPKPVNNGAHGASVVASVKKALGIPLE